MPATDANIGAFAKLANLAGIDFSWIGAAINQAEAFILAQFGQPGVYAAYIAALAIGLFLLVRILKITFAIIKYVVLPSVALAFVGSLILPVTFFYLLPVTVSLSSVYLLIRS